MAEVLLQFSDLVNGEDGRAYAAQACGARMNDGLWQGWIEFLPVDGGPPLRSGRETTQPNRGDAVYWATGLTNVYLEGALHRALQPLTRSIEAPAEPFFEGPAGEATVPPTEGILNPFSVYRNGEQLLRAQLAALSPWHLVNIIRAHALSDADPRTLERLTSEALVEIIVTGVRERTLTETGQNLP